MPVKPSEVEGWTHVTLKKLHKKHMTFPQVHPSERGQSNFHNLQSNVKVLKMRKFRHKDRPCAISPSSENYSATRSRLLAIKIARNASSGSNHIFHKFTNGKGGKAAHVNLQNNVKVLEIMKL
ncbi:hypothetical protein ACFXTN_022701 [Malus domestica]